ncbi:MAG TPA: RDD family protein, partial [Steroidobacteraceae bacterium]|nr:RDD family protein [Steroidobacteraceae bacterium]
IGLGCLGLFGKAVMLAWIGQRCIGAGSGGARSGALGHPALAVLIGGLIVLLLYVVPVLGFVVYKLLGLLGLGAVIYTLVLAARERRTAQSSGLATAGAGPSFMAPPGAAGAAAASAAVAPASGAAESVAAAQSASDVQEGAPAGTPYSKASAPHAAATAGAEPVSAMPRAGFWIRIAALLVDALLVGFVLSAVHHMGHFELVALAAYGAVMWKLRGSTIGGIVFDLRVVRLDGRPVDWETAIVRAFACFLSLAVAGLGFFWIAFDRERQAWHDKIAGTVVVRVARGVSLV